MERAQQELMAALLKAVYDRSLLSKSAYLNAVDLVYSTMEIPPLFICPACLPEEAGA